MTVLFCDIADSTPLAARIGPGRMHNVLNVFFETALLEVHRFEGTVNQFLGDGFMALFGAPVSHEDHARRASLAALAIRKAIASDPQLQTLAIALKIRIGLNTGAVVVGSIGDNLRMDYTAIGDTTNVAARIQHFAEPGTILASDAVVRATGEHIQWHSLGFRTLKGKDEPITLHEISEERAHRTRDTKRTDTTLVGRQTELQAIDHCLGLLNAGQGSVLHIVAEAGLGKSRLLEEACVRAGTHGLRVMKGGCLSFGRTLSYWSFREVIRSAFGIDDGHGQDLGGGDVEGWGKLDAGMRRLFGDGADELLPYVGTLLAMNLPEATALRIRTLDGLSMGHQIFRSVLLLFERIAREQPTVVALEDWHWADASSAELLEHLLPLIDRAPLLFVVASRPDPQGAQASLTKALTAQEVELQRIRVLSLDPLTIADSVELAERLLGGGELASEVCETLLRRSGGNPFYLGELVRALVDAKGIERDAMSGVWKVTDEYEAVPLPDTIEGVILARIDRLEDEVKQVIKAAAVVGRTFLYRVLKAVAESDAALDDDLAKLHRAELIGEKANTPELEYAFKHPLIQQATYDSVLEDRRRALHQHVGNTIEELFAGRLEPFFAMLAYHYAKAEDWTKALEYLFKAAEHADRLAADEEALELYLAVMTAAEKHSAQGLNSLQRAELENKIGQAHFRAGRHRRAASHLVSALGRLGHRPINARWMLGCSIGVGLFRQMLRRFGHLDEGPSSELMSRENVLSCEILDALGWINFFADPIRFVHSALVLAGISSKYPRMRAHTVGLCHVGLAFMALGMYSTANRFFSRAHLVSSSIGSDELLGLSNHYQGLLCHVTGHWKRGVELAEEAARLTWSAGNIRIWAATVANQGLYLYSLGDPRSMDMAERCAQVATEAADRQAQAWALSWTAIIQEQRGEFQESIETLRKAADYYASIPDPRLLAHALGVWSSNLRRLGQISEAVERSEEARKLISKHHLTGSWCTQPILAAAEVRLSQMELTHARHWSARKRAAAKAVIAMLRQGRTVRDQGAVESKRVAGTFKWLCGDRSSAIALWSEGLNAARELGARHAEARVFFERGTRTKSSDDVEYAARLFQECAALGEFRDAEVVAARLRAGENASQSALRQRGWLSD